MKSVVILIPLVEIDICSLWDRLSQLIKWYEDLGLKDGRANLERVMAFTTLDYGYRLKVQWIVGHKPEEFIKLALINFHLM